MKIIEFHGRNYILTNGGSITTPEDYSQFLPSYAHLLDSGVIVRYGKKIGTKEDIHVIREAEENECNIGGIDELIKNLYKWGPRP
jgi:hypothetical protein